MKHGRAEGGAGSEPEFNGCVRVYSRVDRLRHGRDTWGPPLILFAEDLALTCALLTLFCIFAKKKYESITAQISRELYTSRRGTPAALRLTGDVRRRTWNGDMTNTRVIMRMMRMCHRSGIRMKSCVWSSRAAAAAAAARTGCRCGEGVRPDVSGRAHAPRRHFKRV